MRKYRVGSREDTDAMEYDIVEIATGKIVANTAYNCGCCSGMATEAEKKMALDIAYALNVVAENER